VPRHLRLQIADLPFHVIQRGVDGIACFRSDSDRTLYLGLLGELARQAGCSVHAYVLMTNHVHLMITPHAPHSCSLLMKHLGQRFAQHCNRTWGRSGPLWEGRFHSSVVDSDGYLLRCQRYIERNPLRAGMVRHPAEYGWSSFRTNAFGLPSALISPHEVYLSLGRTEVNRRLAYRAMFDVPEDVRELMAIREAARGGFALGSPEFIADLELRLGRKAARRHRTDRVRWPAAGSGLTPV
jgi:REP-associated tyrosine transposase